MRRPSVLPTAPALLLLLVAIAIAFGSGCGGRGGYDADRAMPWLEAQVREIERAQSEAHAAQLRAEQRAYDIERKLDHLTEQNRDLQVQCARRPAQAPSPAAQ